MHRLKLRKRLLVGLHRSYILLPYPSSLPCRDVIPVSTRDCIDIFNHLRCVITVAGRDETLRVYLKSVKVYIIRITYFAKWHIIIWRNRCTRRKFVVRGFLIGAYRYFSAAASVYTRRVALMRATLFHPVTLPENVATSVSNIQLCIEEISGLNSLPSDVHFAETRARAGSLVRYRALLRVIIRVL